jgi:CRISPR/Cas system-associated protein Cas10 (large subunit of type III CRISPR-Cas system)
MVNILISAVGFLLIILLCTEEFREALKTLWRRLTARPGAKYLAYPLAVVLILAAAGLILFSLWSLLSTRFSYD